MSKKALITGITGQDGSYLAELLLSKGYEVHGIVRRSSSINRQRIDHIYTGPHKPKARLFLHYGDLSNSEQISHIIYKIQPNEVYNLGAQSHVRVSFDMSEYTGDITALGTTRLLESIRRSRKNIRFYQASSSEMFGRSPVPQSEATPFLPRSPYAVSKLYSHFMTVNYREGYNLFAVNGILFNHESPRRGETFVTRKVTISIANILAGRQKKLYLGNLKAKRDWGYAPEYVEGIWKMLQRKKPEDYAIGTGKAHSVEEFAKLAFDYVGLNHKKYVVIDKRYFRPTEVKDLVADSRKAKRGIGWKPKVAFKDLVKIMVDADMRKAELTPIGEGDKIIREKFPNRWWKVD
ncbi:MAG: GDP-mannose 4,6-dehydratase [Candidatus Omnitrophica bacterium]|nr:GDP-mannose 4,6-dehydratase [Candidatus Omnitrophota bacterium]